MNREDNLNYLSFSAFFCRFGVHTAVYELRRVKRHVRVVLPSMRLMCLAREEALGKQWMD